jgi:glycosyltransferase involved in cell wall biosynthesis
MKILFLSGRESAYPLNRFLIDCMRSFATVNVILEDGPGPSILKRSAQVFFKALPHLRSKEYDLVFVSFFGHFLMLALPQLTHAPIIFHPFISTYETLVFDRKKYPAGSLPARLAFWLDRTAMRKADHLVMDTQANIDYLSKTFGIDASKFTRIWIGSDEVLFRPRPMQRSDEDVVVLYHGSYLPLQGVDVVIEAARLLKSEGHIRFQMVGKGMEYGRILSKVQAYQLTYIEFLDSVPLSELPAIIAEADICLGGHFGDSDKAARVIAGKTFQDVAMGKATIMGDNVANRELFTHGKDAWFSPPSDAQALADGIRRLAAEPELRRRLGEQAQRTFMQHASRQVITPMLETLVRRISCG